MQVPPQNRLDRPPRLGCSWLWRRFWRYAKS